MAIWWESLSTVMKILWAVTLSASLVFVVQSVMTFIGLGGDTDLDAGGLDGGLDGADGADMGGADAQAGNFDADPSMNLYTFRNLVNFLLGFGWSAILLHDKIRNTALLLVVSILVGAALVTAVMFLFKWLWSMQASGNIDVYKSAVGCEGSCYLTIPAERSGAGKVQISINNSVREYDALTDGDAIKTGASIKVVEVLNASTLLVEPLNSLII